MRSPRMLPAVALVLLALAGCTFVEPGAVPPTETAQPDETVTIDPAAVLDALGPVPPDPELTPELLDDYLERWLDWQWASVLTNFPDAQRPVVAEVERATGTNPASSACVDEARAADSDPQTFAIAAFTCSAEYPSLPNGTLSHDQAGYLYDYVIGFVLPCYDAAGLPDTSTPPTRDFYAANWPFQNWSPQPKRGGQVVGGPEFDTVIANCPGIPDDLQR